MNKETSKSAPWQKDSSMVYSSASSFTAPNSLLDLPTSIEDEFLTACSILPIIGASNDWLNPAEPPATLEDAAAAAEEFPKVNAALTRLTKLRMGAASALFSLNTPSFVASIEVEGGRCEISPMLGFAVNESGESKVDQAVKEEEDSDVELEVVMERPLGELNFAFSRRVVLGEDEVELPLNQESLPPFDGGGVCG
jgi:hypothetical protein